MGINLLYYSNIINSYITFRKCNNDGIIYVLVKKMIHKVNKILFNNKPYQKYFLFLRR